MRIIAPRRAGHVYEQTLAGTPDAVFPLLCPVRETEWVPGWCPLEVRSATGVAEPDCVFTTAADDGTVATWAVTRHDPAAKEVHFLKLTPGVTACRIEIALRAAPGGCKARVAYTHTSLGPSGDAVVEAFTAEAYEAFMRRWEDCLNARLAGDGA